MLKKIFSIFTFAMLAGGVLQAFAGDITPTKLRCEYQQNPGQVDVTSPRLSWVNSPKSGKQNIKQTSYELCVSSSKELLEQGKADVWTVKINDANSLLIPYMGKKLESGKTYYWRVRVWDQDNKESKWSETAHWTMGMLNASDWKCQWIGAPWQGEKAIKYSGQKFPAPLFRKEFDANKPIKSAKFFGTGLGYFEMYCNGSKVSDDVLAPNQANWGKRPGIETASIAVQDNFTDYRVLYLGYDITALLKQGKNAVGVALGNGFYDPINSGSPEPYGSPRLYGQIVIEYADGTSDVIATDTSWKAAKSAIVEDGIYVGEVYDARLEHDGWATAGYNDSSWQNAVARKAPYGHLVAQSGPADRVTETFKPIKIEKLGDGHFKVSFPVEIAGWAHLKKINGAKGDTIDIKYICESRLGINKYVLSGKGNENYRTHFSWFVFSQLEVKGWPGEMTAENITAEAVNSNVPVSGKFECSNDLFNKINNAYVRSQLDNMHGSIASDCPHRERLAYTGDGEVACPAAMANLDAASFYNQWIAEIRASQNKTTGFVPNAAPWEPGAGGGVPWGAAMNIMPWEFYKYYGDKKMLADNYDAMKHHISYMQTWVKDNIMEKCDPQYWQTLGEWVPPYELLSRPLVHTWYYWYCSEITAKTAKILGKTEEANKYFRLAEDIKAAFHKKFYDEKAGSYGAYGGNIFALAMGVPANQEARVKAALKKDIAANGGHLDTGIYGTSLFFQTLAKYGMNEVAYEAMNKTDFPSFGNWIARGATVTWEQWDGNYSRNHPMFGGGLVWFYRQVAGLSYDENAPGFKEMVVAPIIPEKLNSASYGYETPFGFAKVSWKRAENGKIDFEVIIPVGSTAKLSLPGSTAEIKKGSKLATDMKTADGKVSFTLPQGTYEITTK